MLVGLTERVKRQGPVCDGVIISGMGTIPVRAGNLSFVLDGRLMKLESLVHTRCANLPIGGLHRAVQENGVPETSPSKVS